MRLALLVSALAVVSAATPPSLAFAQMAEGPSKTFQGRDIFGIRTAADPQVRPDGEGGNQQGKTHGNSPKLEGA
jgi:S-adenosylmethionine hydrolase